MELIHTRSVFFFFRFTKFFSSSPQSHGTGDQAHAYWVGHLSKFRSASSWNQKCLTLGSSTKPYLETHYKKDLPPDPDTSTDSFIVSNGYNCKYFYEGYTDPPVIPSGTSVKAFCTFQVNPTSPYNKLQFAVSGALHSQNQVLARQTECPVQLALSEFIEFGSLRVGRHLQWHNIHRAIVQGNLSLETNSVVSLICQTVWEAGPPLDSSSESDYWRESDLRCVYRLHINPNTYT